MISYGFFPTTPDGIAKQDALEKLRYFTTNKWVRRCGVILFATPEIRVINGHSYLYGVERCGNTHICPRCTPPQMANARTELGMKMIHQLDSGGKVVSSVFTIPLRPGHDLAYRYALLKSVKNRFRRRVKRLEKSLGIVYSSRYLDEAWGEVRGWNPHFNWLFFIPEGVDDAAIQHFMAEVRALWVDCAIKGGLRGTSPSSQSTELISKSARAIEVAKYVTHHSYYPTKLNPSLLKVGGKWQGLLPFEVLAAAIAIDDSLKAAWTEFELASKGLHRITHYSNLPASASKGRREQTLLSSEIDPDFE